MKITKEYFVEKTGREPEQDDLERCNCKEAGKIGHLCCGWCDVHQIPVFECMECMTRRHDEQRAESLKIEGM